MSKYSVPNMTCGHCKAKIEDAVLEADPGAALDFDMEKREVEIDTVLSDAEVRAAIEKAGYEATPLG
ncbi:MAG: copper chaperone [Alphaproteobacteria bacterium]|nr:MAG: copper chaperone [Alphaproteobacteria bacterium]